ncbi:MAG: sulfite exporter TauE/SafE family protein [Flavobacteriaceae bacterium]|nr:sulfite exporter TauE/SafE family protein [Flavobacteriaceae bacterium]
MWVSALLIGLLGSFHCVGMCGPIAFLLPVDHKNIGRKTTQIVIYHFGRLFAYGLIGVLFGWLGSRLHLFGMQQWLSIVAGVLMIVIVMLPVRIFNKYNFSKPLYKIIGKVKNRLGEALKKKTPDTFLTIGFLNGFLPCGLVYMAVLGAVATGSAWAGGLYMGLFGLGTVPLMTTAIYLGNFLKGKVRLRIRRAIPVMVVVIGCLFILRGMGLGIPYVSPKLKKEIGHAVMECHPVVGDEIKIHLKP